MVPEFIGNTRLYTAHAIYTKQFISDRDNTPAWYLRLRLVKSNGRSDFLKVDGSNSPRIEDFYSSFQPNTLP